MKLRIRRNSIQTEVTASFTDRGISVIMPAQYAIENPLPRPAAVLGSFHVLVVRGF
jgi:hypothetical protein